MTPQERAEIRVRHRYAANAIHLAEHFVGARATSRLLGGTRRALQQRIASELAPGGKGRIHPVPRRSGLSPEEFKAEYVRTGLPVILEGFAKDWPCVGKWSLDFFADEFGDYETTLGDSEGLSGHGIDDAGVSAITMRELVADIRRGGRTYARFDPIVEKLPELKKDIDLEALGSLRNLVSFGAAYECFLGGPGTRTLLHNALPANLFVMVQGSKRWQLFPTDYTPVIQPPASRGAYNYSHVDVSAPDTERYPAFPYIDAWEAIIHEGDVLYNPPFMWHEVTNLSESIGMGYRYTHLGAALRASKTLTLTRLFGTNPPVWQPLLNLLRSGEPYAHMYKDAKQRSSAPVSVTRGTRSSRPSES